MAIYDINGNILSEENTVESYFESELESTIEGVINAQTEPCLTFIVCTDVHYAQSDTTLFPKSMTNMKALAKKVRIDGVFCLGDMTDGNATQAVTIERLNVVMPLLMSLGLPIYFTAGNHDCNAYGDTNNVFTTAQMYQYYYSRCLNDGVYDDGSYGVNFYKDIDNYKFRIISLDATNTDSGSASHYKYPADTVNWFTTKALATVPAGYTVILLTHLSPMSAHNWNETVPSNVSGVLSAINTFINNGGTIISFIGHTHADHSYTSPYLEIGVHANVVDTSYSTDIVNDGTGKYPAGATQWARTRGTYTEDCWDVAVIKPGSQTVSMIRFGAGQNRSYSY